MPSPGIEPVDPKELEKTKPSFVAWYFKLEQNLIKAAETQGFTKLRLEAFEKVPQGNWKYKKVLLSDDKPIARYWLSLRRTGQSKILRVPRFNLETSEQLADSFKTFNLRKDNAEVKLKLQDEPENARPG